MRLFGVLAVVVMGCQDEPLPPTEFDGAAAFRYIEAQLAFGPRAPGMPGHERMARWLDSLLRTRADSVVVQRWSHRSVSGDSLRLTNFLARFNPAARSRILLLAHWDTRPRADAYGSRDSTAPVLGANDGASGVAILLGVADALKASPPAIGVDLLFVDGEDYGNFDRNQDVLLGSRYYAQHLPSGELPRFAVLFDMVGDKDLRLPQEGFSLTAAPDLVDQVWKLAARLGYQNVFVQEQMGSITDDHVPLQQVGIRAIDLIDLSYGPENSWHHSPDDTIDKVSSASLQIVGNVAMALVRTTKP